MKADDIEWEKRVRVCSDGTRAITGKHSGVAAQIKAVAADAKCVH
jgi:hypothetical protein